MLTQRTAHLNDHAGQISFPGGRVDEADADRIVTALREAQEETGLARDAVEVIGTLPDYDIPTGFRVTPVVGWIEPPVDFAPDPFEVAEVFEVPLAHFLDPANHQRHSDEINGRRRNYYAMPYQQRYIWGATAGMLHSLYQVLTQIAQRRACELEFVAPVGEAMRSRLCGTASRDEQGQDTGYRRGSRAARGGDRIHGSSVRV